MSAAFLVLAVIVAGLIVYATGYIGGYMDGFGRGRSKVVIEIHREDR